MRVVRSLPIASMRLAWKRMSGSTTSRGEASVSAAISAFAARAAGGTTLVRARTRSASDSMTARLR